MIKPRGDYENYPSKEWLLEENANHEKQMSDFKPLLENTFNNDTCILKEALKNTIIKFRNKVKMKINSRYPNMLNKWEILKICNEIFGEVEE